MKYKCFNKNKNMSLQNKILSANIYDRQKVYFCQKDFFHFC